MSLNAGSGRKRHEEEIQNEKRIEGAVMIPAIEVPEVQHAGSVNEPDDQDRLTAHGGALGADLER
jgi:hypothetical protein